MKPHLTRKQIEDHPLITESYKRRMIEQLDEHEAEVQKRFRKGFIIFIVLLVIAAFCVSCHPVTEKEKEINYSRWRIDSLERERERNKSGENDLHLP